MDEAELSLQLGSNWLAQAKLRDPENYLESAWRLYAENPDDVLESALLAELSNDLRLTALELRADSPRARGLSPEDLLRSGLLSLQLALSSLRHLEWHEVRARALEMGKEAMQHRAARP